MNFKYFFFYMAITLFWACKTSVPPQPPAEEKKTGIIDMPYSMEDVGLNFTYNNGSSGEFYLPEIIGAGGAFLDYDNDGDLDVFLPQAYTLGKEPVAGDRLFRNQLVESGSVRFEDVTESSGISGLGYGMGAATGDFNNDGFMDLYVTNFGSNTLYKNLGGGRFEDVTEETGADDVRWSVSASFFDYNGDGFLDLFIGNYTTFTLATHVPCFSPNPVYCHPLNYDAVPDKLLQNMGDGTFQDVSASSNITSQYGRALGVVTGDFNGDGLVDIYVANDGSVNQFWVNLGKGVFEDRAMLAGCGLNASGLPEAGMGVDAADFDKDGDQDLFITHLMGETNTLYVNDGSGNFEDQTTIQGLAMPSQPFTGFGTGWTDYNNDGFLDILAVNGSVSPIDTYVNDPFPYHQGNQLFRGNEGGGFSHVTGGDPLDRSEVSRGALFGDLDNDGDEDVLVINNNGPARVLLNRHGHKNTWFGLRVLDANRDALGSQVGIYYPNQPVIWFGVHTDGGYATARDPRVLVGVGNNQGCEKIRVVYADGEIEDFPPPKLKTYTTLIRGNGTGSVQ